MAKRRRNDVGEFLHGKNHHTRDVNRRRNAQNHRNSDDSRRRSASKEVDLHDLGLPGAQEKIKQEIIEGINDNECGILFTHGSNNGTVIRDWMRNGSLKQFLTSKEIDGDVWPVGNHHTCVSFK